MEASSVNTQQNSSSNRGAPLLEIKNLVAGYGAGTVLQSIDFSIYPGETVVLIGRNGVGKTTLIETIMGLTSQHGGELTFDRRSIRHMRVHQRNQLGIGWVPQEREVFPSLTVEEHLTVAASPGRWTKDMVYDVFPRLCERSASYGDQLSGGEQQLLAIGRALMTNPRLLLLDEPLEGLAPLIVKNVVESINRMRRESDMAILLVEQKYEIALANSERCIVLDRGEVIHRGKSRDLLEDSQLLNRLVGVEEH